MTTFRPDGKKEHGAQKIVVTFEGVDRTFTLYGIGEASPESEVAVKAFFEREARLLLERAQERSRYIRT